jgi:hypothetical protein
MHFYSILTDLRQFSTSAVRKKFDDFLTDRMGLTKLSAENG